MSGSIYTISWKHLNNSYYHTISQVAFPPINKRTLCLKVKVRVIINLFRRSIYGHLLPGFFTAYFIFPFAAFSCNFLAEILCLKVIKDSTLTMTSDPDNFPLIWTITNGFTFLFIFFQWRWHKVPHCIQSTEFSKTYICLAL